jgi:carboxylesterase type B
VEKEGTPNAGLWDQRAVLEWIQKYGGNFGGDINNVSLWGESAGAGSIAHHLTAFGGEKEALFKRAVIQSPAFDPTLDRKGTTEKQFQDFAKLAKCESKGLACLRSADTQTIRSAQKEYGKLVAGGKPGWGPAVDGDFVQKLPVVDMAAGKFAKGIESIINSHTADEAAMFVPSNTSSIVFNAVLEASYKASPPTMDAIRQHYASLPDDKSRIKALYGHSTFTCSNRWIAEYFPGKTYNVEYGRGLGYHGTDLLANFYTDSGFSVNTLATLNDRTFGEFAKKYQSYLVSHARTGDPNTFRSGNTPEWPRVKIGDTLTNVMNATNDGFALGTDMATQSKDCTFWKNTLMKMSDSLG